MNRHRALVAAMLTAVLLATAACGVPAQDDPEEVDPADVPFGLTEETPSTTPTPTTIPVSPDRGTTD